MADGQQPDAITEHHLTVSRTARYAMLGGRDGAVEELWVVCHGYGQRAARFIRHFDRIATERRRIVAPEALSRFYLELPGPGTYADSRVGASWMTSEERESEISDYVEYLNAVWRQLRGALAPGCMVTSFGFSQGAATAARWAVLGEALPARLILWAGGFPKDLFAHGNPQRVRQLDLTLVAGREDGYTPEAAIDREIASLTEAGLTPRLIRYEGGHAMHGPTLEQLAH
jgi:predicted esterase